MDKISRKYLRYLRVEHGYSLREFADKIYASKSAVQRWEKSFVPEHPDVLEKISEVLNISVDEMRRQSAHKYGNSEKADKKNELSPEQLTELKFGAKWLTLTVFGLSVFAFLAILFLLL